MSITQILFYTFVIAILIPTIIVSIMFVAVLIRVGVGYIKKRKRIKEIEKECNRLLEEEFEKVIEEFKKGE